MPVSLIIELTLGLAAGGCVLLSYFFTNQIRLRIINVIGSVLFVCYGFGIAATTGWGAGWTTIILNTVCCIVHFVWLIKYKKGKIKIDAQSAKKSEIVEPDLDNTNKSEDEV